MSIRTVTCPACNSSANVMPSMTNIKCPSCGVVWDINNPDAGRAPQRREAEEEESGPSFAVLAGTFSTAIVFLAIVGIMLVWISGREQKQEDKPAEQQTAEVKEVHEYREVDLPESTRKKIYSDYRKLAASSIERTIPLPKNSPVRNQLEDMLQKTVDREITHFSLLYNITEDDVQQIVYEGDAKNW